MTPQEVLTKVLAAGGRVVPDPQHPRLLVPPALKPLVAEHREALRALILREPPPLQLDPVTLREVLGPTPDPEALYALQGEVAEALAQLNAEIRSGCIAPGPILVRGRPLADWLPLETVAAWLGRAGKAQRTAR